MLTLDELRNIIHRSRSIEGIHGDEVSNDGRFEFTQVFLHAGRLKLEDGYCAAFLEQFVGQFVVNRNMIDIYINTAGFLDITQAFFNNRQGDEAEKVHFD